MKFFLPVILCALFLLYNQTDEGRAESSFLTSQKKVIVIDPGHGGYDSGAKTAGGTFEKNIALTFAKRIASELGNIYTVILTRHGDLRLGMTDRTSMANHLKADLFISIHTGGGFHPGFSGLSIFYYEELPGRSPDSDAVPSELKTGRHPDRLWDKVQKRHAGASRFLAESIKGGLLERVAFSNSRIEGAPIGVLAGADMPAVLVEIGYLTNPVDEKNLTDTAYQTECVQGLSSGIDDFFKKETSLAQ